MRKLSLALGALALLLILSSKSPGQNTTCSDRPAGDSSNACANTRFVQKTAGATAIQPVDVVSLGAKCDWNGTTGTDDHVIIQNAVNTYKNVLIPSQCYIGTSTITFGNQAFSTLTGINSEWSALINASTNTPTISVVAATAGLKIQHLGVTKPSTITALAGAIGILYNGFNDLPVLDDVEVQRHYNGLSLSSTGYGKLQNSYIHLNTSDGIIFQNPTILNDYQWNLDTVLSESNGGWGVLVVTSSNVVLGPKSSQGTWTNAFTFNNTSGGIKFLGNATVPIQGIRLNSPFLGSDKGPELVLDTFNTSIGSHIITNAYLEFNTSGPCMQITANNNGGISIVNPAFSTCFTAGLTNAANNVFVTGGFITAAGTFSIVNSNFIDVLHVDLLGSVSGPLNNTGTYTGHLNLPASANIAFTVPEGGTGLSSGTSGGIPCFNSATTMASSVAMTVNSILIGGGAGACPTPLVTATGINTWLGTPSSANLRTALTDETGTGLAVFNNAPALISPTISGSASAGGVRIPLTANTTFNVATTGVDSNNCTSGAPCLTVQRAYDNLANFYDLQGFTATIQLANGTYTSGLLTAKCVLGQNGPAGVQILGSATPSNVIWSTTSADTISLGASSAGAGTNGCTQLTVGGMRLQTTTGGNTINVAGGGVGITIGTPGFPIDFGASAQNHIVTNHSAWAIAGTNNSISGSAVVAHVAALSGSQAALHNTTITCTGSPAFGFFAYSEGAGSNIFLANITFSGCGTVTGSRYFASKFGTVTTLGSLTYLPGNAVGTLSFFGQYVGTTGTTSGESLTATSVNVGPNVTTSALLTANRNVAAPSNGGSNTIFQLNGVDGTNSQALIDNYGTGIFGIWAFRAARGTGASFTASQSGDTFGLLSFVGASAANTFANTGGGAGGAFISGSASENWSATAQGSQLKFFVTTNTTAAISLAMVLQNSTGLSVGVGAADPGAGKVGALNGFVANGLAGITTVCTIAVGNVLTFTLGILTAKGGVAGCT